MSKRIDHEGIPELSARLNRRPERLRLIPLAELFAEADKESRRAVAYWRSRGWTKQQAECFVAALDDLESAWVVFVEAGDPDRALWRLVDAAGRLAEAFPEERAWANGTGYRLEKVEPGSTRGHRWEGSDRSG